MGLSSSGKARRQRIFVGLLLLLCLLGLTSCSTLGYYGQAAWGQAGILLKRRDIAQLAADPETPPDLRQQLQRVQEIREFALEELGLPDNGSYRTYVQLAPRSDGRARRAVVWNVVAAGELDTTPVVWCFPVAGCVSYRGYFSEARARRFADKLAREGYDVDVAGASAYSTLGWFQDPVLSTVIDYPEVHLAGLLFHELAHQVAYAQDDTRFNESFATTVEVEGIRRWLAATDRDPAMIDAYLEGKARQEDFNELLLKFRDRLRKMYAEQHSDDVKRQHKEQIFSELEAAYRELSSSWSDAVRPGYDRWFERQLNNARLVSVAEYHDLVPAFEALLAELDGDLQSFYTTVRELAEQSQAERHSRLQTP